MRLPILSKQFNRTMKMLKAESGSALMIALFTVTILMVAAMEIVYQSNVEFQISAQQVNDVKAYYAAKSGIEISLLRIHIYKKAMAMFGSQIPDKSLLDMIWNTPFAWPPPVPESMNAVDKDSVKKSIKGSSMKSTYAATISSEGSKIDLNGLASPSTSVQEATKKLILQIFTSRIDQDRDSTDPWVKQYRNFNFDELVNNIADWVDTDEESKNGGPENRFYQNINTSSSTATFPPNRPFQSIDELHMVAGMDDQIYEMLAPKVTVFGSTAVNVNYASKEILMALDEKITSEVADKIIESRTDPNRGPFKDLNDFLGFIEPLGVPKSDFIDQNNKQVLPLAFDPEYNFRIESVGSAGKVTRKITAVVFDFDQVKDRLTAAIKQDQQSQQQQNGQNNTGQSGNSTTQNGQNNQNNQNNQNQQTQQKPPTDRPNVVYWLEE